MPPATSVLEGRDLRRPTDAPRRRPLRGRGGASGGAGMVVGVVVRSGRVRRSEPRSGVRTEYFEVRLVLQHRVWSSRIWIPDEPGIQRIVAAPRRVGARPGTAVPSDLDRHRRHRPPAQRGRPPRTCPHHPSAAAGVECPRTPPPSPPSPRSGWRRGASVGRRSPSPPDPPVAGGIQSPTPSPSGGSATTHALRAGAADSTLARRIPRWRGGFHAGAADSTLARRIPRWRGGLGRRRPSRETKTPAPGSGNGRQDHGT